MGIRVDKWGYLVVADAYNGLFRMDSRNGQLLLSNTSWLLAIVTERNSRANIVSLKIIVKQIWDLSLAVSSLWNRSSFLDSFIFLAASFRGKKRKYNNAKLYVNKKKHCRQASEFQCLWHLCVRGLGFHSDNRLNQTNSKMLDNKTDASQTSPGACYMRDDHRPVSCLHQRVVTPMLPKYHITNLKIFQCKNISSKFCFRCSTVTLLNEDIKPGENGY